MLDHEILLDRNDTPLNFRVSSSLRREFKTYAAQNDLKLNELLKLAFDAYKVRGQLSPSTLIQQCDDDSTAGFGEEF